MEKIKFFKPNAQLDWSYDEEADVLYISAGKPREAVGLNVEVDVVVRYDERTMELVGLTIIGLKQQIEEQLQEENPKG